VILKLLPLPAAVAAVLLIAATSLAQMPEPPPYSCGGPRLSGGIVIAYHAVLMTPPVGHVYSWTGVGQRTAINVCVQDLESSIVIDSQTGAEIVRYVNHPDAGPVLDQILASVRINPMPTPVMPSRLDPQPPRPTPGPELRCSGINAAGGDVVAYDGILVTLPPGYVYNWTANRDAFGDYISICAVELASHIVLDSVTGKELLRDVKHPDAGAVLDQIAAGTRINPRRRRAQALLASRFQTKASSHPPPAKPACARNRCRAGP
jgi:hypothetical protein